MIAFISALMGLVSGALPDLMKEWTSDRASRREADFLRLQNELALQRAKVDAEDKLRESHDNVVAAEIAAMRENLTAIIQVQATPTGVLWIDCFNALLRPLAVTFVLILFMATSTLYVRGVVQAFNAGQIQDSMQLATLVWGSMVGESVQAVLGFLFGYRSVRGK